MKYSDKCDVVLLIRLRHLPRFRDDDRWERMVTDIGIDDEGNALRNLFTLVSDTRSTHFLSLSNVSVSDTKVAKTLFRWRLSGALCSAYPFSVAGGGLMVFLFQIIINEKSKGWGKCDYDCVTKYLAILKIAIKTKDEQEQSYMYSCPCWRQR